MTQVYRFDRFELGSELLRDGELVHLEPKPRAVLRYLLERTHRRVPASELLTAVWHGEQVSSASVHNAIGAIRRAIAPVTVSVAIQPAGRCTQCSRAAQRPETGSGGAPTPARPRRLAPAPRGASRTQTGWWRRRWSGMGRERLMA